MNYTITNLIIIYTVCMYILYNYIMVSPFTSINFYI